MSYLKEIVKLVTGSPKVKENWNTRECEGYLTKGMFLCLLSSPNLSNFIFISIYSTKFNTYFKLKLLIQLNNISILSFLN